MTTYVKSMSDAMAATDPSKDKPQPTYVMSIKANWLASESCRCKLKETFQQIKVSRSFLKVMWNWSKTKNKQTNKQTKKQPFEQKVEIMVNNLYSCQSLFINSWYYSIICIQFINDIMLNLINFIMTRAVLILQYMQFSKRIVHTRQLQRGPCM